MSNNQNNWSRIDDIGPDGWRKAFNELAGYLTKKLRGHIHYGPFSEDALGCRAVEYFSKRAFDMLLNDECYWPENVDVTTQLIRNANSEMKRVREEWEDGVQLTDEEARREAEIDERAQNSALKMAYRFAMHKAADDQKLQAYILCVREEPDYHAIARRMKIPLSEVLQLEQELLRRMSV